MLTLIHKTASFIFGIILLFAFSMSAGLFFAGLGNISGKSHWITKSDKILLLCIGLFSIAALLAMSALFGIVLKINAMIIFSVVLLLTMSLNFAFAAKQE